MSETVGLAQVEISGFEVGKSEFKPHAFYETFPKCKIEEDVKGIIDLWNQTATQGKKSIKEKPKFVPAPMSTASQDKLKKIYERAE